MAMFFALLPGATPHFVSSKNSVSGLRDRALIPAMLYSFARVSAVVKLKSDDYHHNGARRRPRPHHKFVIATRTSCGVECAVYGIFLEVFALW
jgi:hypothetical protein